MDLPTFRYHPNPLATGMVVQRTGECACCGRSVDFLYVGPIYSRHKLEENVCPWCIADGSLHARFQAMLADDHPLLKAGMAHSVVEEVTTRTPGYVTWQQDQWLSHCGDACAFHGDASLETLRSLPPERRDTIFEGQSWKEPDWRAFLCNYKPGGDPAIYHFRCMKCHVDLFNYDCS